MDPSKGSLYQCIYGRGEKNKRRDIGYWYDFRVFDEFILNRKQVSQPNNDKKFTLLNLDRKDLRSCKRFIINQEIVDDVDLSIIEEAIRHSCMGYNIYYIRGNQPLIIENNPPIIKMMEKLVTTIK